ncbi:apolipoprotein D-like [Calliphora vicina]|uniref:apolipoprotein D-like n=1 Tax=Calliphora vicina TaxID=7373 RepID=UPI00325BED02
MAVSKIVTFIAVLVVFATTTQAQVITSGICPCDVDVVPSFDVSQYLGVWYEYAKYPMYFEADGVCITAEYTLQPDGNVGVKNSLVNGKSGAAEVINGYASVVSNAKLMVTFPVSPAYNTTSNYWVLDTDYCTFSVVYSCQPSANNQHSTIVWILTRERVPSTATIDTAKAVLVKNNISLEPLTVTKQQGC